MKKLIILMFVMVFFLSFASAFEFDNKLTYSNNDLKVDFDNSILGLIKTSYIGSIKLESHHDVNYIKRVGAGSRVTMWYESNFVKLYKKGLGTPIFTDERTGEIVEREWRYVYWGDENYESPVVSCKNRLNVNGSIDNKCTNLGTETKTRKAWLPYNSRDIPKGKIKIGIEVNVRVNDYIDGVWEIVGKKIKKHALWEAGLEIGLDSWYKFEEDAGDYQETHFKNTTLTGSPSFKSGHILTDFSANAMTFFSPSQAYTWNHPLTVSCNSPIGIFPSGVSISV